ncbi:MAG TPA: MarP family serine protease, partial [Solirubrobacteraceae bacterium]|nr:MarP family serine protease [Solirubrobacteraceae bacterium]
MRVTAVDWVIVAFCALLALYGYAQGFIVGVLSLIGFGVGAFIGTRIGPLILPGGSHSQYAPLFGLLGALLAGGVLASGLEGIGLRARMALRLPGLRAADGLLGGVLTACVGLGIVWILGAVALDSTGSPTLRNDIQRSAILRELDQILPPSGPILNALARFDPLPSVTGPAALVPPPPPGIARAPAVSAAEPSVMRVVGTACGLGIEGSGWVAAPGLVVTNAHVVAGETDTTVEVDGNPPGLPAALVVFDPHDDIAVLRVGGLTERTLPLAPSPSLGTPAAIIGYPLDGPLDVQPGRIGQTKVAATEDAYGNGPVLRSIEALRGLVRPGNSGGPLVDSAGQVVGTVFAAITGTSGNPSGDGLAVPNSLVRTQLARAE